MENRAFGHGRMGFITDQPSMVQVSSKILTLAEFLELLETKPATEYINGQIIQKPIPHLRSLQIGQLKYCLLIKAKQKSPKIFFIV